MAQYVDGFVIPVSRRKVGAYLKIAQAAANVWMEHGALEYRECVGDDLKIKICGNFPDGIKTKPGETVVFSWIVYKSKAHRDQVNKKVMKDPRIANMSAEQMPFDCKRMLYGGFKVMVSR